MAINPDIVYAPLETKLSMFTMCPNYRGQYINSWYITSLQFWLIWSQQLYRTRFRRSMSWTF